MINSQLLLYLNLGFGLLLVLYFVLGRPKPKQPTRLNMRAKNYDEKKPAVMMAETNTETNTNTEQKTLELPSEGRSLSVMFMYNGHSWEAHEVLGVPQGASMHQVTLAYQELVKKTDVKSLHFYEHAYLAISTRHQKNRL